MRPHIVLGLGNYIILILCISVCTDMSTLIGRALNECDQVYFNDMMKEIHWMIEEGSNPFYQVIFHPDQFQMSKLKSSFIHSPLFDVNLVSLIRKFVGEPHLTPWNVFYFMVATQKRRCNGQVGQVDFERFARWIPIFKRRANIAWRVQDSVRHVQEVVQILDSCGFDHMGKQNPIRRKQTIVHMIQLQKAFPEVAPSCEIKGCKEYEYCCRSIPIVDSRFCLDHLTVIRKKFMSPKQLVFLGICTLGLAVLLGKNQKDDARTVATVFGSCFLVLPALQAIKKSFS